MQHRIIRQAAIALFALLLAAALAFGYATGQREHRHAAAAAPSAPAAPAPIDGFAAYEKRCAKCHETEEMQEWLAGHAASDRRDALRAWLQSHAKSPEAENAAIAAHVMTLAKP
jgi:hypothetical protein